MKKVLFLHRWNWRACDESITMLMAAGMDTNGFTVVPIIVDPHLDLDEKKICKL